MYYELILAAVFFALGTYLTIGTLRTYKALEIRDMTWSAGRILFMVCAVLSVISIVTAGNVYGYIRFAATLFCIIAFMLNRDGMGASGVVASGRIIPWSEVTAYDYQMMNKKFYVYYLVNRKGKGERDVAIAYDGKDKDKVIGFLKKTAGKKYRRMKKDDR